MSDRLTAGQVPFSTYQRSTAELIVALLWLLTLVLAVSLEMATRGTIIAAMIPRIVTTANNSISEKPARLRIPIDFIAILRFDPTAVFKRKKWTRFSELRRFSGNRLCKRRSKVTSIIQRRDFFLVGHRLVGMAGNASSGCI